MKNINILFVFFLTVSLLTAACNDSENTSDNSAKEKKTESADQKEIRKTLDTYNEHFKKAEYAEMTNYIYPGLFQDFTKEEMIEGQKQSMHSELFDVSIKSITIDSISEVYSQGADKYALAIHRANNIFQFKNDATQEILDAYCINFKNNLGEDNVKCNIAEKNFDVTMQDISFIIYSDKDKKWYTLGTTNPADIDKFIPEEVREKLGLKGE
jgi:hypothetical protein